MLCDLQAGIAVAFILQQRLQLSGRGKRKRRIKQEEATMDKILTKLASENKDFPLIEVMVVIACIGILVTIAMQKFLAP
jgi:hypothetical protein